MNYDTIYPRPTMISRQDVYFLKQIILQALEFTALHRQNPSNVLASPHSLTVKYQNRDIMAAVNFDIVVVPCICDSDFVQGGMHVQITATQASMNQTPSEDRSQLEMKESKNKIFQKKMFEYARNVASNCHVDSPLSPNAFLESINAGYNYKPSTAVNKSRGQINSFNDADFIQKLRETLEMTLQEKKEELASSEEEEDEFDDTESVRSRTTIQSLESIYDCLGYDNSDSDSDSDDYDTIYGETNIDPRLLTKPVKRRPPRHPMYDDLIIPPEGRVFTFALIAQPLLSPTSRPKCKLCSQASKLVRLEQFYTAQANTNDFCYLRIHSSDQEEATHQKGYFKVGIPFPNIRIGTVDEAYICAERFSGVCMLMKPFGGKIDWLKLFPKYCYREDLKEQNRFPAEPSTKKLHILKTPPSTPKGVGIPKIPVSRLLRTASSILCLFDKSGLVNHGIDIRPQCRIGRFPGIVDDDKEAILRLAESFALTRESFEGLIRQLTDTGVCPPESARQYIIDMYYYSAEKTAEDRLLTRRAKQEIELAQTQVDSDLKILESDQVEYLFKTDEVNHQEFESQTMLESTGYLWMSDNHPDSLDEGDWGPVHIWNKTPCNQRLRITRELENGLYRLRVEGRNTTHYPTQIFNVQPMKVRLFYNSISQQVADNNGKVTICRGHLCAELVILRHQLRLVTRVERSRWKRLRNRSITMIPHCEMYSVRMKNHIMLKRTAIPTQFLPAHNDTNERQMYGGTSNYVLPMPDSRVKRSSPLGECWSQNDL